MNDKGLFQGWWDAMILVGVILIFLCFLAAFPGGGKAALEFILESVRCFLGTCESLAFA